MWFYSFCEKNLHTKYESKYSEGKRTVLPVLVVVLGGKVERGAGSSDDAVAEVEGVTEGTVSGLGGMAEGKKDESQRGSRKAGFSRSRETVSLFPLRSIVKNLEARRITLKGPS